eukprot:TRINITY_DN44633_c0_g1_i1.p1 TRINITY_DN44633_c0_g1~~TRINITY_DN44633_c0_g1_i1.p1  ORF type:complete len:108 (+),score=21.13 TRINITY_DN44633_c0_g1_i1:159-482(+)
MGMFYDMILSLCEPVNKIRRRWARDPAAKSQDVKTAKHLAIFVFFTYYIFAAPPFVAISQKRLSAIENALQERMQSAGQQVQMLMEQKHKAITTALTPEYAVDGVSA